MTLVLPAPSVEKYLERQSDELESLLNWLTDSGPISVVGIVLQFSEELQDHFTQTEYDAADFELLVQQSFESRISELQETWRAVVGSNGLWSKVQLFPQLHTCVIQGPNEKVRELFESDMANSVGSPMLGFIYGGALCTAETAQAVEELGAALGPAYQILESFGLECFEMGVAHADPKNVSFMAKNQPVASILGDNSLIEKLKRLVGLNSIDEQIIDEIGNFNSEYGYLNQLKIGDPERWTHNSGEGQTICIIDSGADESHPMIQRQVKHYARFDVYGNYKDAFACMDHACHGTKIAAWVCGRKVRLTDLGFDQEGDFRIGIAPKTKTVIASAMCGDMMREFCSWPQFFAGLEFAVQNRRTFEYEVVTISMESQVPISENVNNRIDLLFELLDRYGIVPILAAGNRGKQSYVLGTKGTYVGSCDWNGIPASCNGPKVDLLAPGNDLICGHPQSPRLNNCLVGKYGGSSLSAAIVSGAIAVVASTARISAKEALSVIKATSNGSKIDIDAAIS